MNTPLWTPSKERIENSNLFHYQRYLSDTLSVNFESYEDLHAWSVNQPDVFWKSILEHGNVIYQGNSDNVLVDQDKMPGCKWFPEITLNFAENLLRFADITPDKEAFVFYNEQHERESLTFATLKTQVTQLAAFLKEQGVVKGDRVAGFMPNMPHTVVAMLATTSLGAIWSSCSPDFGLQGVIDRFGQIQPKVLFACDGYYYNGKTLNTVERVQEITSRLDNLAKLVVVPFVGHDIGDLDNAITFDDALDNTATKLHFEQVPFDHPLYIMYSSGTTGVPKCIVHSVGGTLLQHIKELSLHTDLKPDDTIYYFTTCGWMMWNWLVSSINLGATTVLYDGSPFYPEAKSIIDILEQENVSIFGTSAKYISALEKAGIKPRESHRLPHLKSILSTGSPLSHESFDYVYRDIKADVCLSSISGGTDIISCFALGNPCLSVHAGQLQCVGLGMDVAFYTPEGTQADVGEKGELVCLTPFPSMPIGFWNDPQGEKFHKAYFNTFDNIWAHGDYAERTPENGVIIHGRSDAVLNPGGVRIGTAEIYRQVEKVDAVVESIAIGQQWQDDVRVVLFVRLRDDVELNDALINEIKTTIRANTTPRHVPAKVIQVADIPRTISGKIVELAVRNVVHGKFVKNKDALANPEALSLFKGLAELKD